VSRKLFESLRMSTRAVSFRRTQLLNEYGVSEVDEEFEKVSRVEYGIAIMTLVLAMSYLFLDGSYLLFSDYIKNQGGGWATVLWQKVAKIDKRYLDADEFVMSQNFISAVVFGPACLVYAWALMTRRIWAHVMGITLSVGIVIMQLMYFMTGVQMSGGFKVGEGGAWVALWWVGINVFCRFLFPLFLTVFSHKRAIGLRFEHEDLSVRLKKEEDHLNIDAAEVLFGGSNDDLTRLVAEAKEGCGGSEGGGSIARRRQNKPFALAQI